MPAPEAAASDGSSSIDQPLRRIQAGNTRWYLADALGSTVALADSTAAIQTGYDYTPYGKTTSTGATDANPYQFTGREHDASGLSYYRARYYQPEWGRFISQDPIGFAGGDTNLYAYTWGSPTNYTDPSGTNPLILGGLINAAIYAFTGRKTSFGGLFQEFLIGAGMTVLTLGVLKLIRGPASITSASRAPHTATQRIFRAVEPDELADLAGSGAFRTARGLEGKYFWPTRAQADDFAAMATKANMGGPYCVASGCIPAHVLRQIEAVPMDGLGPAYFIPERYLSLIDDIVIHGG